MSPRTLHTPEYSTVIDGEPTCALAILTHIFSGKVKLDYTNVISWIISCP